MCVSVCICTCIYTYIHTCVYIFMGISIEKLVEHAKTLTEKVCMYIDRERQRREHEWLFALYVLTERDHEWLFALYVLTEKVSMYVCMYVYTYSIIYA